ncbi:hypothetical protein ACHAWT_007774 [Skeletonema menzelii]
MTMEAPPPPVPLHENNVPTDLICSICMTVPAEPRITPCNHLFCQKCIRQALDDKYLCPIDRQPCSPHQLRPLDGLLSRVWGGIQVKCGHHEYGCAWRGSISDYSAHTENNCSVIKHPTVKNNSAVMEELHRLRRENYYLQEELSLEQQTNARNTERFRDELETTKNELSSARKDSEMARIFLDDLQRMPRNTNGDVEDICLVMRHTACTMSEATCALKENDNKLYNALVSFTNTTHFRDIELVMSQANCSRRDAIEALVDNDSDLVNAIMSLCT